MSRKGSLDACTVLELKEKAAKRGIKVTGLNKAEIIAKLRGKQTGNGFFSSSKIVVPDTGLKYPENTEFFRRDGTGRFVLKKYITPPHYTGKKGVYVYGTVERYITNAGEWQFNTFNDYILPSELETNYILLERPPVPLPRQMSFDSTTKP